MFFQLPLEPKLTVANYYLKFVEPTERATKFFTCMTILMLISGTIMLVTEWFTGTPLGAGGRAAGRDRGDAVGRVLHLPAEQKSCGAHFTDAARLKVVFAEWARLNRIRAVDLGRRMGGDGLLVLPHGPASTERPMNDALTGCC